MHGLGLKVWGLALVKGAWVTAIFFKKLVETFPKAPYRLPLWNWAPKDHPYYGFGEPNSIIVVYMEQGDRAQQKHPNGSVRADYLPVTPNPTK